jgi:uncharacterized membrane protein HdeD (DUF308 family)
MTDASTNTSGLFVGRWWTVLLRGLTAVAFGLLTFAWPHLTIKTLVLLFGFYALIHGMFSLMAALGRQQQTRSRWLLALEGIIGIGAGLVTLRTPSITAMVLIFFIWIWAIATGILRIVEAIRLRKEISGEVWLGLSGVLTLLFGVLLMLRPMAGLIGLAWVIAGYALILGIFEIMLGFELRSMRHTPA